MNDWEEFSTAMYIAAITLVGVYVVLIAVYADWYLTIDLAPLLVGAAGAWLLHVIFK